MSHCKLWYQKNYEISITITGFCFVENLNKNYKRYNPFLIFGFFQNLSCNLSKTAVTENAPDKLITVNPHHLYIRVFQGNILLKLCFAKSPKKNNSSIFTSCKYWFVEITTVFGCSILKKAF